MMKVIIDGHWPVLLIIFIKGSAKAQPRNACLHVPSHSTTDLGNSRPVARKEGLTMDPQLLQHSLGIQVYRFEKEGPVH